MAGRIFMNYSTPFCPKYNATAINNAMQLIVGISHERKSADEAAGSVLWLQL